MRMRRRAIVELALAALALAGAIWSWVGAQSVVSVAPILAGEPQTTSVAYSPPLLVLMLVLATVAGILAVDGVARLRRIIRRQSDRVGSAIEAPATGPASASDPS